MWRRSTYLGAAEGAYDVVGIYRAYIMYYLVYIASLEAAIPREKQGTPPRISKGGKDSPWASRLGTQPFVFFAFRLRWAS